VPIGSLRPGPTWLKLGNNIAYQQRDEGQERE